MRLILEKRADRSAFFAIASPFLALLLTLVAGGLIFALPRDQSAGGTLRLFHRTSHPALVG